MSLRAADAHGPDASQDSAQPGDSRFVTISVRFSRVFGWVAVLAVVFALVINWWAAGQNHDVAVSSPSDPSSGGVVATETVELEKPAIDLLPGNVLQYETITRQPVPGMDAAGAEAVYKTLNMNLEAQIAVVVYARVEGFASQDAAQARIQELMSPYTTERASTTVGVTPAIAGYTPDKGAYAFGWTRGRYATYVKATFAEWVPAHSHDIAKNQGVTVAGLVEFFQRTGKQGVQAK